MIAEDIRSDYKTLKSKKGFVDLPERTLLKLSGLFESCLQIRRHVVLVGVQANADIEFFTDRAAFEAACPGLLTEDFESLTGRSDGMGFVGLAEPVNSMTSEGPVLPGDIMPGFSLLTVVDEFEGLVLLDPLFAEPVPSNMIVASLSPILTGGRSVRIRG